MLVLPYVSLIVATRGRENVLVETLESIFALEYPAEKLDIIVVDQTEVHEDSTQAFLNTAHVEKRLRWYRPPEVDFLGLPQARNYGLEKAKTAEIVIFVDDDVVVDRRLVFEHVAQYRDPIVGAVAGRIIDVPPDSSIQNDSKLVGQIDWLGRMWGGFNSPHPCDVMLFRGCNFSVRRNVFEKTGLFDERFSKQRAHCEDSDLALRVRESGLTIRFAPHASLMHRRAPTGGCRVAPGLGWYYVLFYDTSLFYAKHAPRWRMVFFLAMMWRAVGGCLLHSGSNTATCLTEIWRAVRAAQRVVKETDKERRFQVVEKILYPIF